MTASHKSCASASRVRAALRPACGPARGPPENIKTPVNISVLDDSAVNAFTLPGGRVLVMRGLIARVDDGTELAGVIAHELGHVAHRDPTTQLLRGMGLSMLLHMLGLGDASNTAASGASNLMSLAYTREAEVSRRQHGDRVAVQSRPASRRSQPVLRAYGAWGACS